MRILIVEDDPQATAYLQKAFAEQGHLADTANNGIEGFEMAKRGQYDVVIADRMMPKQDGITMIERLRAEGEEVPILILSALSQVDQRVEGLKAGGDDYLTKPYSFSELLARAEALIRRRIPDEQITVLEVHDLVLNRLTRKVERAGNKINLQPREFRLLDYLMRHSGQVVTRTMLLENVWEYHFDPNTNVIDVHIHRLRSKIDRDFDVPLLHTIRGAGYTLTLDP